MVLTETRACFPHLLRSLEIRESRHLRFLCAIWQLVQGIMNKSVSLVPAEDFFHRQHTELHPPDSHSEPNAKLEGTTGLTPVALILAFPHMAVPVGLGMVSSFSTFINRLPEEQWGKVSKAPCVNLTLFPEPAVAGLCCYQISRVSS